MPAWMCYERHFPAKMHGAGFGNVFKLWSFRPKIMRLIRVYLQGQGDLVSRLIMGISGVTIWVIGVLNLLTKSP